MYPFANTFSVFSKISWQPSVLNLKIVILFYSKIKLKSRKNDLQLNPTACTPPEIRPKLGLSGQINEPWSGLYTFISKGSYTQLKGTSIAKTSILLCTFKGTVTMLPFSGYTGRLIPMDLPIGFAMIPKAKT